MRQQATRLDVLEAQRKTRENRRAAIILAPLALLSLVTMAAGLAGLLTP